MPEYTDAQRKSLPIPDPPYEGALPVRREGSRRRRSRRSSRCGRRQGAPNVLVVLIDDVGFGASSAFGGPIDDAERRAPRGQGAQVQPLPHDGALLADARRRCSPDATTTPSAWAASPRSRRRRPGYNSIRPNTCAPLAETLKLNGYSTAQFGKCHEVPVWETSPMGPFDAWPTGSGFEYFYGFIGGEAHQYYPAIYEGTIPVEPEKTPEEGYHFMADMTDKAIKWVRQQKALMPRQAVLRLLRARRDARPAPRHAGVGRQVQGPVRRRLGRAARADLREAEGARRDPRGRRADPAARGDPRLGRHARGAEAGAAAPDGDLRRLPRVHRPPRRPPDRRARGPRGPGGHARLLHHRRQRRLGRGHAQRHLQRDDQLQRRRRAARRRSS